MGIELLHHVQLAMPSGGEERAREFYQGLLGIPEVPKPGESTARSGCWFERGCVRVHLGVEADFRPARKAHPAFVVRDLATLAGRLAAAGYECRAADAFADFERIFVSDPFGNRVELLEHAAGSA
jgi:catechol 2,3-dioxygenase-like lactoylglutathione lyase family enzyme